MRQLITAPVCIFLLAAAAFAGESPPTVVGVQPLVLKSYQKQGWLIQETSSFRVFCLPNLPEAKRLPEACEELRRQLQETWLGENDKSWTPRCDIVVHASVAGYVRELGAESRQSSGCATIDIEHGKVAKRRVDLRADAADWLTTALPHELTHVVIAGRFSARQIPRWADEGIAILAEPGARQAVRRKAMQTALYRVERFSAAELISLRDYPAAARRDAFYGQSASLVTFLIERDSPAKFLDFLEAGQKVGYERALADVYQIRSLADLDARWRPQLLDRGPAAELFASRISRITAGSRID
jgi:hypothetical protein